MREDEWQRVNAIFDHVVDKSPSHRKDYLDIVCEEDPDLRVEIERMLTANDALEKESSIAISDNVGDQGAPEKIGAYTIDFLLGSGGMGSVYQAHHPTYGIVALKLLPAFYVSDPIAQLRFRNEANVLAKVAHPSLCRLYESFIEDDFAAIAMELVDGETLSDQLKRSRLGQSQSIKLIQSVAETLKRTHAEGVFHRDIKPGNIIISCDETIKLIDFGVAKFSDVKLTATGQAIGSPHYMSPEQWQGKVVDGRTDLWSLGVVWYEMLTGQKPFRGKTMVEIASSIFVDDPPPLPESCIDGLPLEATGRIIGKLLQKDPDDRIDSCKQLLELVGSIPDA